MKSLNEITSALYNEILTLIGDSNITRAKENLDKLYSFDCKDIEVINLLGMCNYKFCRFDEARELWNKSINLSKVNNRAEEYLKEINSQEFKELTHLYNKGKKALQEKSLGEALYFLKMYTEVKDDLVEPYLILSLIETELENYENAIIYVNKALYLDKGNIDGVRYLENINRLIKIRKKKSQTKRISIIVGAIAVVGSINTLNYIGENKDNSDNNVKTVNTQGNVTTDSSIAKENMPPIASWTLLEKAMSEYKNSNYDNAIEIFQYICDSDVKKDILLEGIYWCGKSYEKLGNEEKYIYFYELYIEKGDNNYCYYDDLLYFLAEFNYNNGNNEKAKEYALKLQKECKDSIFNNSKVMRILE